EAVNQRAGVGEGVNGLAEIEPRSANLHPQSLRIADQRLGLRDVVLELLQPIAHFPSGCLASHGGSKLWILRIVATGADRILLHSQELVAGLSRFVGAVARSTPRQPRLLELVLHACFREQLGDLAVAGAAGI